jgi:hypothetical protein
LHPKNGWFGTFSSFPFNGSQPFLWNSLFFSFQWESAFSLELSLLFFSMGVNLFYVVKFHIWGDLFIFFKYDLSCLYAWSYTWRLVTGMPIMPLGLMYTLRLLALLGVLGLWLV